MADIRDRERGSRIDFSLWKKILPFFYPYRKKLYITIAMMLFSALVDAAVPLFTKYAVNHYVVPGTTSGLQSFVLLYLILILLQTATTVLYSRLSMEVEMYSSRDLKRACFVHLQKLPLSFYNTSSVGYVLARVMSDTNHISGMVAWAFIGLCWHSFYLLGLLVSMFFVSVKTALIVLCLVPAIFAVSILFRGKMLAANRNVRHQNSAITSYFNEHINGAKTTKTLVNEDRSSAEFQDITGRMYDYSMRVSLLNSVYLPLISFLGSLTVAAVLHFTGSRVITGALDFGVLSAFISYAICILDPITVIARMFNDFMTTQVNVERVTGLLEQTTEADESPEIRERFGDVLEPQTENYPPMTGDIRFEHVFFRYPDAPENDYVLEDVSFSIPAGTTVALVGETGAGKSTLVNLVCRFFEPTHGRIYIDGRDYREFSRHWLHSNLGYVQQTPHLFSGSVAYNIRYGNLSATDKEVERAAQLVSADQVVARLEEGYATDVGENGDRLSTGEKQLVSFARAMIADPPLFILDEATSSIDTETESLIQSAISRVLPGRTAFIIAHRLSTIRNADLIFVVEEKGIAEAGTHEQLMKKRGHYYSLYRSMMEPTENF